MDLMKMLSAALFLSLSLNAAAQDNDELADEVTDEEVPEVTVPTSPTEKHFFHRVQLGFQGTPTKYTNFGESPDYNNYFMKGISFGWMGDFIIAKKFPLYLELGGLLSYHTGKSKDVRYNVHHDEYYKYKVNAFALTIPVSVNYQFRKPFGVEDLTIAPSAGLYLRFNVMAKRKATAYREADGSVALTERGDEKVYTASLMSADSGPEDFGESLAYVKAITEKLHTGKLVQAGVQVGANAYYKNYFFGISYMRDLTPFASHSSSPELTVKETAQGGRLPNIGTDCDMKISTANNFLISVGYIF